MTVRSRGATNARVANVSAEAPTSPSIAFDPVGALDDLLSDVGLSRAEAGVAVSFAGRDPILPAAHRLGA